MGLDWKVGHKPALGHEETGWELLRASLENPDDPGPLAAWLAVPNVPSWVTIDAPQVGSDADADEWFLRHAGRYADDVEIDPGSLTEEDRELLAANRGYYVVALAEVCDGTPPYSHAGRYEGVDETSFRGAFLHDAVDVIGEDLLRSAYERKLPAELLKFGQDLHDAAVRYASANGVEDEMAAFDPPQDDGPGAKVHIVASAARWCLFWADKGHWLDVWV